MLKRFFSAVILVVFMFSAQIVFAAVDIDWNSAPRISSKSDLANYIEDARQRAKSKEFFLPIILTGGLSINEDEFVKLSYSTFVTRDVIYDDGQTMRVIFYVRQYPGTRVANAYLSNDTSDLSADEMQLYNVALGIVNEANKKDRTINKEYYIYTEIMNRAEYFTGEMNGQPRFVTAIGALVDGKANCQGYTDAFYMLGRMLGLNVGRLVGEAGGGGHIWNTMTFEDGKTYCVDVTWGDHGFGDLNSYIYFNAPVEIMQETHKWDWSSAPALQGSIDVRYSYGSKEIKISDTKTAFVESSNSVRTSNAETGLRILARRLAAGSTWWFTVMTPYDERYADINRASDIFADELSNTSFVGEMIFEKVCSLGNKYLFFCAYRSAQS